MNSDLLTDNYIEPLTVPQTEAIRAGAIYYGLPTEELGLYIIGNEKLKDVLMCNLPLLNQMHEVPQGAFEGPRKMQWETLLAYEREYSAVMFTVRHKGELIGVIGYMVNADPANAGKKVASLYGFYIEESHRKGALASKLFDYTEKTLKAIGTAVIIGSDYEPVGGTDLSPLYKRKKFKLASRLYVKEL